MPIDTIAVFHSFAGVVSAWGCSEGITTTLSRMDYGVIDCGNPSRRRISLDVLKRADLIILSGPENYWHLVKEEYGPEWNKLTAPKVAWYTESAHRDDTDFDFQSLKGIADLYYYPAIQDAEEFGGNWLPFAADTEMFRPLPVERICFAGFVGNLYPKRVAYMRNLTYPLTHLRPNQHPNVIKSFEFLAQSYCSTEIFVNLPAYSRLLVTKVTEAMACGRMVITPAMDHPSAVENMGQFVDGRHLIYYDPAHPKDLGDLIDHYLQRPEARKEIANAGLREIHRAHTMRDRLRTIIADVEFGKTATSPFSVAPHFPVKSEGRILFSSCPLCEGTDLQVLKTCPRHKDVPYHPGVPVTLTWIKCSDCSHVFTDGYFAPKIMMAMLQTVHPYQVPGDSLDDFRPLSEKIVNRVSECVQDGAWLDVGFGNGSLLLTAKEHGFMPVGIDLRPDAVEKMKKLGVESHCTEMANLQEKGIFSVVSMADVLEHMPFPREAIATAHRLLRPDGVLFVSMPDHGSPEWCDADEKNDNPYWNEIEHHHNFSEDRLRALMEEFGFKFVNREESERYVMGMELIFQKETA